MLTLTFIYLSDITFDLMLLQGEYRDKFRQDGDCDTPIMLLKRWITLREMIASDDLCRN